MAKTRSQFVCQNCGRVTPAFMGRCPQCHEFGTMVEQVIEPPAASGRARPRPGGLESVPQRLPEVTSDGVARMAVEPGEFARVLGGGIVPGSLILLGGDPGIGKSTLLLEVAARVANTHGPTLYVSGEESVRQIKMRADRLGLQAHDLFLVTETSMASILAHVDTLKPVLMIVDSIQTTHLEELTSAAGSVSQRMARSAALRVRRSVSICRWAARVDSVGKTAVAIPCAMIPCGSNIISQA